ncbi:MAG TPA: DNA polymerase IV [Polyangiaceae bacterium]|nr:DNA polymerase IV [Polyangiaceae bacterium]
MRAVAAPRVILHADMDAFFASIEMRDRPELANESVIVGGLSSRGVVSAASYRARSFGVRSAMPMFEARRLCPQGVFIAPNMAHYAEVSAAVHQVFLEFTPEIEPIALDEAFLDITHSIELLGAPDEIGSTLKRRVRSETNLTVSVGIASSKLVAKIACTKGKPDGLIVVEPGQECALLHPLPVRRLWGIGPVAAAALERRGIQTVGQLSRCRPEQLQDVLGNRAQEAIEMAHGRDPRVVIADRDPKSYGEECTFEADISDRTRILETITAHSEAVARRLRRDGKAGKTITLKLKLGQVKRRGPDRNRHFNDAPVYPQLTRSHTLPSATNDGAEIRGQAIALWESLGVMPPIRLLGVSVSGLQGSNQGQLELFGAGAARRRLSAAMDAIESRFGQGAIRRGTGTPEKLTPSSSRKRGE